MHITCCLAAGGSFSAYLVAGLVHRAFWQATYLSLSQMVVQRCEYLVMI